MAKPALVWSIPPAALQRNATGLARVLPELVLDTMQRQGFEAEASMKARAPWTDDTGVARDTLYGDARRVGDTIVLDIGGQAAYQPFLETMQGGRYGAVTPEFRERVSKVADAIDALLRGLSR